MKRVFQIKKRRSKDAIVHLPCKERRKKKIEMENRNYADLSRRLEALSASDLCVETAGLVEGYPVYLVHLRGDTDAPRRILLTAGVHGDEPAGVEAALRFLERDHTHLLQHFQFCVLPCINPTGYVRNTRESSRGVDINRAFEENEVAEVQLIKKVLGNQQFDCFVDFHEDWEATGFYLYEGKRDGQWIGEKIIQRVETIGPIDPDTDAEDPPLSRGVYQVASDWGTRGLAPYILQFHVSHVFICETPTSWDIDRRAAAHLAALDTVLAYFFH